MYTADSYAHKTRHILGHSPKRPGLRRRVARGSLCLVALVVLTYGAPGLATGSPKVLTVRRDGVGPLTKTTPVDAKVLGPMFRGCKLQPVLHSVKGKPVERTVAVTCHQKPLYTLHSEMDLRTLAYVEVHAPKAVTQDHVARGDTVSQLMRRGQLDCDAGVDPNRRLIVCTRVGQSAFGYQIHDTGHGQAGILPQPQALKKLTISGLIWRTSMI